MFDDSETLKIVGRSSPLFESDMASLGPELKRLVHEGRFLVVGGAGSIGQAVVKLIAEHEPRKLHVVDISENNLAELVRDFRSSKGDFDGDFHAFCIDALSIEFEHYANRHNDFDYVLNLAALKHVRSEKDPYTLSRLVRTNVLLPKRLHAFASRIDANVFFNVSTDKATNPVSMMGASKRLMEVFLASAQDDVVTTSARFANVAFSDGSLPFAWLRRLEKRQPIVAPHDIFRYFITSREAGILCLLATLRAKHNQIYVPRLTCDDHLVCFTDVAIRFLHSQGKTPALCNSEEEARSYFHQHHEIQSGQWPCYFFPSSTSGEKRKEEFFDKDEQVIWTSDSDVGILNNGTPRSRAAVENVIQDLEAALQSRCPEVKEFAAIFSHILPEFKHSDTGSHLDARM